MYKYNLVQVSDARPSGERPKRANFYIVVKRKIHSRKRSVSETINVCTKHNNFLRNQITFF